MTVASEPTITIDSDTNRAQMRLRVLIYNVAGLPWPLASNRPQALQKIGEGLKEMRSRGEAPHIVMLQEAFISACEPLLTLGGYPNIVGGPKASDPSEKLSREEAPDFIAGRRFLKGEKAGKWLGGGLAIMSDFPILERESVPFRRRACAGFDCLSNKGMLLAAIHIPGLPEPVEFFTTHMNSKRSSGVPRARYNEAHRYQSDEVQAYLFKELADDRRALIAGGDFNMTDDRERLEYLTAGRLSPIVRVYCQEPAHQCDIRTSYDGDEPWLDTPDLQVYYSGENIQIRPLRIEAVFDEPVNGRLLSDHDGYMVTYELSWSVTGEIGRAAGKPIP